MAKVLDSVKGTLTDAVDRLLFWEGGPKLKKKQQRRLEEAEKHWNPSFWKEDNIQKD